ncbi:MAG: site-specific tyrosine recombinase XerC, partial [Pyrinomonadaceae bacterium]
LRRFEGWCEERSITRAVEVTKPILERYMRWLYHYRQEDGRPLSYISQYGLVVGVRMFFRWLARNNYILWNPASELELPRREKKRLPKHVLSIEEAEAVINQPEVREVLGMRDRAMLETFYSTGMRRMELIGLKVYDVDTERGTVMIRQGKGKKDRMIPIGERAIAWVEKYLTEARPEIVVAPDEGRLFITKEGRPLCADYLSRLVKRYVEGAEIGKSGSCHLFRHTCATLMLEGGADIRYIQQMLGHAQLETTEMYTQVTIRTLKAVHAATHPARMQRVSSAELSAESSAENKSNHDEARREELLFSLAAEAAEEEQL